jgi:hypothetical protein
MIVYGIIWQPKASLTALATIAVGAAVYHFGISEKKSGVRSQK